MQALLLPAWIHSKAHSGGYDRLAGDGVEGLAIPVRIRGRHKAIRYIDIRLVHGQLHATGGSSEQAGRSLSRCREEPRAIDLAALFVNDR